MKRHGITKSLLENDELRHVFAVSYRTYRHSICLGGDLYCAELWNLVGKSDLEKYPVCQYIPGNVIRIDSWIVDFDGEPDMKEIEDYFETVVGGAVVPIVHSMQTPSQCVTYAKSHRCILGRGTAKADEVLAIWSQHYGLT